MWLVPVSDAVICAAVLAEFVSEHHCAWVQLSNKQQAKYVEVWHKQEETYWLCQALKVGKVLQRTEETVQMLVTGKESEIKKVYCWKAAWVGHLYENYMN